MTLITSDILRIWREVCVRKLQQRPDTYFCCISEMGRREAFVNCMCLSYLQIKQYWVLDVYKLCTEWQSYGDDQDKSAFCAWFYFSILPSCYLLCRGIQLLPLGHTPSSKNQGRVILYWWREWPVPLRWWNNVESHNSVLITFFFGVALPFIFAGSELSEAATQKCLCFFRSGKFSRHFLFNCCL